MPGAFLFTTLLSISVDWDEIEKENRGEILKKY